jgi:hypothetical protein
MPYVRKAKCVYNKRTRNKVGCSKSIPTAKKYMKALYAAEEDEETFNSVVKLILADTE